MNFFREYFEIIVVNLFIICAGILILSFGSAPLWCWLAVAGSIAGGNIAGWYMTRDKW